MVRAAAPWAPGGLAARARMAGSQRRLLARDRYRSVILPQLLVAANSISTALLDGDAAMTPSHRAGELARQGPAAAAAGWNPDLLARRQAAVGPVRMAA